MPDSSPKPDAPECLILASLSTRDRDLLMPLLHRVDLPLRKQLERRDKRIDFVYFIGCGMASVVAADGGRGSIEIGVIGREGVTGMAVIMATDRSPHETYMQLPGTGHRISAASLRVAMGQSKSLHQALLRFAYAFSIQTAQTALANGRFNIEERLARWLLMAHDRIDGDELPLTHEFMALMLGVRRPGVTVTLRLLEDNGMVKVKRGGILIVDRGGLEECANGSYGAAEAELRRLTD